MAASQTPKLPEEVYGIFCWPISQDSVQKIFAAIATASQNNVKHIHLLFQSIGGSVSDGIALYNFFKTAPVDL
jgi:ATP-dependent protease ClpP protease subunit